MKILQLVPGYGKDENALFHYAQILASNLEQYQINSVFDPTEINRVDAIFLNYSNYGFQKKGVPFLLLKQLEKIVRTKKVPVYVFFHELYAAGYRPHQSSFWLSPLQKKIYQKLYQIASYSFCSNEQAMDIMQQETFDKGKKLKKISIFCNVPESLAYPDFSLKEKTAIVFGTYGRRLPIYENAPLLNKVCEKLGIIKIIDIGDGAIDFSAIQTPIEKIGRIDLSEMPVYLEKALFGFIDYKMNVVGKSGIFAAYSSYGLVSINFFTGTQSARDGVLKNENYLEAVDIAANTSSFFDMAKISANAYAWYQQHNAANHSSIIAQEIINQSFA